MTLRSRNVISLVCIALAACRPAQPSNALVGRLTVAPSAPSSPSNEGGEVSVELRGPTRVRYEPSLLSAARPTVRVVVRNRGSEPLDVSNLRVRLDAVRDGVRFRCAPEVGPSPRSRERAEIAVGRDATFERSLDCELPLVGEYRVELVVAFGRTGRWSTGQVVRTMTLQVVSGKDNEPRELSAVPGLWAAIGASSAVPAASGDVASKLGVSFVNGSGAAVDVGQPRLALRVYRRGSPIPCEDEPVPLSVPTKLEPGQSWVEVIGVSCLGLHVPGHYDVVGRLVVSTVDGRTTEQEIGRVKVEVSSDPLVNDRANLGPGMR